MTPDDGLIDVTIKVPASQVGAFYRMAGEWLQGRLVAGRSPERAAVTAWGLDPDADRACARTIVDKLSGNARSLFEHLLRSDAPVTSAELAEALGFPADKGASMVAGTLAWPGRHATAAGREFPVHFSDEGSPTLYWMVPEAVSAFADAFAQPKGGR